MHRIKEILRIIFHKSMLAEISYVHETPSGWVTVMTCKLTGNSYLLTAIPIKSIKIVASQIKSWPIVPDTADELLKMNKGASNGK